MAAARPRTAPRCLRRPSTVHDSYRFPRLGPRLSLSLMTLDALENFRVGAFDAGPAQNLYPLAGLEVLVMLEEMLDLFEAYFRHIVDRFPMREQGTDIIGGYGQQLRIAARLIVHAQHAQRAAAHDHHGS